VFYQPMIHDKVLSTENAQSLFTEYLASFLEAHERFLKNLAEFRNKGLVMPGIARVFEKLVGFFSSSFLPSFFLQLFLVNSTTPPSTIYRLHPFQTMECILSTMPVPSSFCRRRRKIGPLPILSRSSLLQTISSPPC